MGLDEVLLFDISDVININYVIRTYIPSDETPVVTEDKCQIRLLLPSNTALIPSFDANEDVIT